MSSINTSNMHSIVGLVLVQMIVVRSRLPGHDLAERGANRATIISRLPVMLIRQSFTPDTNLARCNMSQPSVRSFRRDWFNGEQYYSKLARASSTHIHLAPRNLNYL